MLSLYRDNTTLGDPQYLNLLNHSWALDHVVVFLISGQGHFRFLNGHIKHNTHIREGGRKEEETITGLGQLQEKERRSLWHFLCILCAIMSMHLTEILTKPPGMLTHLLTLANLLSQSTGSSSRLSRPSASPDFCRLLSHVDYPVLSTALVSSASSSVLPRTFLPSSSSGLVGGLTHMPFVWVSHENRQRNLLTGTYPHPHSEWATLCHIILKTYMFY